MAGNDISNCWYSEVCADSNGEPCKEMPLCIRYLEMANLMDTSGLPKAKQHAIELDGSEDYNEFCRLLTLKSNIKEFVQGGYNLTIASSNTGNGKTSWAIKLMLKYFDEIWAGNGFRTRAIFVHVPTVLLKLKDFDNSAELKQLKKNLMEVDLVVWDDIGSTSISAYDYTQLLLYLEHRLLNERSNIFTTNLASKKLMEESLGGKLASRIWDTSEVIIFKGGDRRRYGSSTNFIQGDSNEESVYN